VVVFTAAIALVAAATPALAVADAYITASPHFSNNDFTVHPEALSYAWLGGVEKDIYLQEEVQLNGGGYVHEQMEECPNNYGTTCDRYFDYFDMTCGNVYTFYFTGFATNTRGTPIQGATPAEFTVDELPCLAPTQPTPLTPTPSPPT
jgi:hypothetical protein